MHFRMMNYCLRITFQFLKLNKIGTIPYIQCIYYLYTGITHFIALCFISLHKCCVIYKLKARPSTAKRSRLTLLWCSGTESAVSPRYVCTHTLMWLIFGWYTLCGYTRGNNISSGALQLPLLSQCPLHTFAYQKETEGYTSSSRELQDPVPAAGHLGIWR